MPKITGDFWRHLAMQLLAAGVMGALGALAKVDWSVFGAYALVVPMFVQMLTAIATEAFNQALATPTASDKSATPSSAPQTIAKALLCVALLIGLAALGSPQAARAANLMLLTPGTINLDPIGLNKKLPIPLPTPGSLSSGVTNFLTDVMDYFSSGMDEAETLSLEIPSIQDGNGHDCAVSGQAFIGVLKVHPMIISGHAAADLEGLRIIVAAAQQICASQACQKVFAEGANAISTLGVGMTIPLLPTFCAKLPTITLVPPALPVSTPSPAPSPSPTAN